MHAPASPPRALWRRSRGVLVWGVCGLVLGGGMSGVAAAAPVAELKPSKLRTISVVHAEDPATGATAVVTHAGEVWAGKGAKLKRVGDLRVEPNTAQLRVDGERVVVWASKRTGLSIRTRVAVRFDDGRIAELRTEAPVLDARFGPAGRRLVVLLPGELVLMRPDGEPIHQPLPVARPRFADSDEGVHIAGRGLRPTRVDLTDGCMALKVPASASAWARVQADRHGEGCGGVPATDPAVLAHAEAWRTFQGMRAARMGDLVSVAAYGYRGSALESLRPRVPAEPGALSFGGISNRQIPGEFQTGSPVALVYRMLPGMHPGLFVGGDDGAACLGAVVLVEADRGRRVWLKDEIGRLRSAGVACADDLHVARPEQMPPQDHDAAVFYIDHTGAELGWRSGIPGPGVIRDDLARFGADPAMKVFVENARTLSPEWSLGPGPGTVLALDVDGSWLGGVGWDIARATPEGYRQVKLVLPGPVTSIAVDPDGRYAVDAGGQHVKVLFEGGTLGETTPPTEWMDDWSVDAPRDQKLLPEAWPIEGQAVRLPGRDRRVLTGGKPIEVHSWPLGAIVRTRAGLVGLWADGDYAWRIPDVESFVVAGDLIVVATRYGLSAYRPPTTKLQLKKPAPVEEDTGGGQQGGASDGHEHHPQARGGVDPDARRAHDGQDQRADAVGQELSYAGDGGAGALAGRVAEVVLQPSVGVQVSDELGRVAHREQGQCPPGPGAQAHHRHQGAHEEGRGGPPARLPMPPGCQLAAQQASQPHHQHQPRDLGIGRPPHAAQERHVLVHQEQASQHRAHRHQAPHHRPLPHLLHPRAERAPPGRETQGALVVVVLVVGHGNGRQRAHREPRRQVERHREPAQPAEGHPCLEQPVGGGGSHEDPQGPRLGQPCIGATVVVGFSDGGELVVHQGLPGTARQGPVDGPQHRPYHHARQGRPEHPHRDPQAPQDDRGPHHPSAVHPVGEGTAGHLQHHPHQGPQHEDAAHLGGADPVVREPQGVEGDERSHLVEEGEQRQACAEGVAHGGQSSRPVAMISR